MFSQVTNWYDVLAIAYLGWLVGFICGWLVRTALPRDN